jgi:hypothetical protein
MAGKVFVQKTKGHSHEWHEVKALVFGLKEKVTATKSRQLAGHRERGCPSFADSPASTACVYKCAAQLMQHCHDGVLGIPSAGRAALRRWPGEDDRSPPRPTRR